MRTFAFDLKSEALGLRQRISLMTHLVLVVIFGILLPWWKGVDFLDPVILGVYSCLGVLFSAPAAATPFQGATFERAVARIAVCVAFGELVSFAILATAIITIHASRWGRVFVGVDVQTIAECAFFGLMLSVAVTTVAVWMTLQFSPAAGRAGSRLMYMGLLFLFFLRSRWLPDIALRGSALALVAAAGAFFLMRAALSERNRS